MVVHLVSWASCAGPLFILWGVLSVRHKFARAPLFTGIPTADQLTDGDGLLADLSSALSCHPCASGLSLIDTLIADDTLVPCLMLAAPQVGPATDTRTG